MDNRGQIIKEWIQKGRIKDFHGMYEWMSKTAIAEQINVSKPRLNKITLDVSELKLREVYNLARAFDLKDDLAFRFVRKLIEKPRPEPKTQKQPRKKTGNT